MTSRATGKSNFSSRSDLFFKVLDENMSDDTSKFIDLFKTTPRFVFVVLAMWVLGPSPVLAENENRIGFVDIPYLIQEAPQAVEAEQRLEAEFAPRQDELATERERLNAMSAELTDVSSGLSEDDRMQLDREVRALERRIKRSEQDFREELNIQKNNEFKHVRERVLDAIARFGREHDYDLIVSDGVL